MAGVKGLWRPAKKAATSSVRVWQYASVGGAFPDGTMALNPDTVDLTTMTDLIMHNASTDSAGNITLSMDAWGNPGDTWGKLIASKARTAGVKTYLSIAGDSGAMLTAMKNSPQALADNLVAAATQVGVDGIFIDYEPMTDSAVPYVVDLGSRLRGRGFVTGSCSGEFNSDFPSWHPDQSYWQAFDLHFLMCYDMSGPYGNQTTWHNAAIYGEKPTQPMSVDYDIRYAISTGARASQLIAGSGAYALAGLGPQKPGDPWTGGQKVGVADNWPYDLVVANLGLFATVAYDDVAKAPWAGNPTAVTINGRQVTYLSWQDDRSLAELCNLARTQAIAGVGCWAHWYSPTYNRMLMDAARGSGIPASSSDGFVRVSGTQLTLNGNPWRPVGLNLPYSMGWGGSKSPSDAQHQALFQTMPSGSLFRMWAFGDWTPEQIKHLVDLGRPYGHKFLLVLADYQPSGEKFASANPAAFVAGGWKSGGWRDQHLIPMLQAFASDNAIAGWAWINEMDMADTNARAFFDEVGALARQYDSIHPVFSGTASPWGDAYTAYEAINGSSYVDVVEMHEYDENEIPSWWVDKVRAHALGKPVLIGEFGVKTDTVGSAQARADRMTAKISAVDGKPDVCGVLYWSGAAPGSFTSADFEIDVTAGPEISALSGARLSTANGV